MKTRLFLYAVIFFIYLLGVYAPTALSRQGETLQSGAKLGLGNIAKAEDAYFSEHDRYTDDLGRLDLDPTKWDAMRYQFDVTVPSHGQGYVITARSKSNWSPYLFDSKEVGVDVWEIDQDLKLKNTVYGVEQLSMIYPIDLIFFWGLPLLAFIELVYASIKKTNNRIMEVCTQRFGRR